MKHPLLIISVFSLLSAGSCRRVEKCCDPYDIVPGSRVMVLCEGNFQWGNADFDLYIPDSQKLYSSVFKTQNGQPLGDVLQSAVYHDGKVWLVLNNSGKLTPVDISGKGGLKEITGLKSPRYVLPVKGDIAWVTDLYDNRIAVVDLKSATVTGYISCNGWTEQLLRAGQEIAVANFNGKVFFYSEEGVLKDSVLLRSGARWLETDKEGKFWALASDSGKSILYRINPGLRQVEKSYQVKSGFSQQLAMNKGKDTILFIAGGLYAMDIHADVVPSVPLFSEAGAAYYGLAVDPESNLVYLSDAEDYVSKGEVVVLRTSGAIVHRFRSGINPCGFLFLR